MILFYSVYPSLISFHEKYIFLLLREFVKTSNFPTENWNDKFESNDKAFRNIPRGNFTNFSEELIHNLR